MLYAKINPTAKVYSQINPFSGTTVECNYMSALARPYGAGASQVNFEVIYGTIIVENNVPTKFNRLTSSNLTLLSSEMNSWGIDDTVHLDLIGTKLGVTTSDYVTINENHPF